MKVILLYIEAYGLTRSLPLDSEHLLLLQEKLQGLALAIWKDWLDMVERTCSGFPAPRSYWLLVGVVTGLDCG